MSLQSRSCGWSDPQQQLRFVLDVHLGKLARLMRLLGFDSRYRNDYDDAEIVRISVEEGRVALTRDRGILERRRLIRGYRVRSEAPLDQIREVLSRFDLRGAAEPFSRCTVCNGSVRTVTKVRIEHRLPAATLREHGEFLCCSGCGRVYWKGSHYDRMRGLVERMLLR